MKTSVVVTILLSLAAPMLFSSCAMDQPMPETRADMKGIANEQQEETEPQR